MSYIFSFLLILSLLISCQTEHESFVERINQLAQAEKYEKAKDMLRTKLESKRDSDEVISRSKPRRDRIMKLSEDRNRIVWAEDNRIIFRDIANPIVKTKTLTESPYDLQISANGEYALVSFRLKNTKGCRMKAYSLLDDNLDYESGAHISCRNKGSISQDGNKIFYFIDESLFYEKTSNPKKPIKLIDAAKIAPPFPKLKNKYSIVPIDSNFLLIAGIAGSYNLYFYHTDSKNIELLAKDILSPKTYYAHGKTLYLLGGKIGSWYLREILYSDSKKPKITTGFTITIRELEPWKMTGKNDFLSFYGDTVFQWGPMVPRKEFPLLCERGWGLARDMIVYENKDGELILSNTAYTEEEWTVLRLYEEIQKKIND
ncbi:MAG: hypothetical protein JJT78_09795 [Leptospira sp.]|nr:hypothetical protein [Leptospira sp.]